MTGGLRPPGSFSGSLPSPHSPAPVAGCLRGLRGLPEVRPSLDPLPLQNLVSPPSSPGHFSGSPAGTGTARRPRDPLPSAASPQGYLLRRQLHVQGPRSRTGRQRGGGRARGRRGDRAPDRRRDAHLDPGSAVRRGRHSSGIRCHRSATTRRAAAARTPATGGAALLYPTSRRRRRRCLRKSHITAVQPPPPRRDLACSLVQLL